jgi:large conductance mechanosensitive channel
LQGNILDLAIGIIIGTAFQNVVKSLVDDIITPPFGLIFDGVDFSNLTIKMPNFVHKGQPPVVIRYGLFIQQIIHLLVLAFALFGIVKLISRLRRIAAQNRQRAEANEPTQPSEPPEPSEEVKLLRNIRDLLEEIRNVNVTKSIASSSIESSSNLIHL